jgi:hypothetical protein
MLTISPSQHLQTPSVHCKKHSSKARGAILANISPKVSCEGIPSFWSEAMRFFSLFQEIFKAIAMMLIVSRFEFNIFYPTLLFLTT